MPFFFHTGNCRPSYVNFDGVEVEQIHPHVKMFSHTHRQKKKKILRKDMDSFFLQVLATKNYSGCGEQAFSLHNIWSHGTGHICL